MTVSLRRILRAQKGQSLIELTLILPLMVLLAYGAIEVGMVISTHMSLTHTTREGANLASRGTPPNDALDAIILAGAPRIGNGNRSQWKIFYSRIIQDPDVPCPTEPCVYIVDDVNPEGQIFRGTLNKLSKLGTPGTQVSTVVLPGIQNVKPGQTFHVFEVFYDYAPNIITYVGKGINTDFYDRTVFTNTSGT